MAQICKVCDFACGGGGIPLHPPAGIGRDGDADGGGGDVHCQCKTVGKGGSVSSAAYRSAELLYDRRTARTYDYRRKRGVVKKLIVAPRRCRWAEDRNSLWNAAEAAERRQRATTAREWLLALPAELASEQREALARAFAEALVARYGVAADVAIHQPSEHGDQRNHHAHILMTSRVVEPEGLGAKTRVLDDLKTGPVEITAMRAIWAGLCNAALEAAGSETRLDHRSLKVQREEALAEGDLVRAARLDREPTQHRGPRREHAKELRALRTAQLAEEAAELARAEAAAEQVAEELAEGTRLEAERVASAERARVEAEIARQEAAEAVAERKREEVKAAELAQEAARKAAEELAARERAEAERVAAEQRRQAAERAQEEAKAAAEAARQATEARAQAKAEAAREKAERRAEREAGWLASRLAREEARVARNVAHVKATAEAADAEREAARSSELDRLVAWARDTAESVADLTLPRALIDAYADEAVDRWWDMQLALDPMVAGGDSGNAGPRDRPGRRCDRPRPPVGGDRDAAAGREFSRSRAEFGFLATTGGAP